MIKVAVAGGVALYGFCVVMAAAGFTSIVPLVVIVPILVLLIGGGNLLGGRNHGRSRAGRMPGFAPPPLSSSGPNGPLASPGATGDPPDTDNANSAHADREGHADPERTTDPEQASGKQHGDGEPGDHE